MSSVIQAVWPPRVAVLFQFGRALLRNQRALSGKPIFWQPYRCTTPGCWPRGIAGVMDPFSAGGTTEVDGRTCSSDELFPRHQVVAPQGFDPTTSGW